VEDQGAHKVGGRWRRIGGEGTRMRGSVYDVGGPAHARGHTWVDEGRIEELGMVWTKKTLSQKG
jgi:hypothetical protein